VRPRDGRGQCCHTGPIPPDPARDTPHPAAPDRGIAGRRPPVLGGTPTGGRGDPEAGSARLPVLFYRAGADDPERARDLGVALARLSAGGKGDPPRFARRALELLEERLASAPEDAPAGEAKGQALSALA